MVRRLCLNWLCNCAPNPDFAKPCGFDFGGGPCKTQPSLGTGPQPGVRIQEEDLPVKEKGVRCPGGPGGCVGGGCNFASIRPMRNIQKGLGKNSKSLCKLTSRRLQHKRWMISCRVPQIMRHCRMIYPGPGPRARVRTHGPQGPAAVIIRQCRMII